MCMGVQFPDNIDVYVCVHFIWVYIFHIILTHMCMGVHFSDNIDVYVYGCTFFK